MWAVFTWYCLKNDEAIKEGLIEEFHGDVKKYRVTTEYHEITPGLLKLELETKIITALTRKCYHRHIQNPTKHLRWKALRKYLTNKSRQLLSRCLTRF